MRVRRTLCAHIELYTLCVQRVLCGPVPRQLVIVAAIGHAVVPDAHNLLLLIHYAGADCVGKFAGKKWGDMRAVMNVRAMVECDARAMGSRSRARLQARSEGAEWVGMRADGRKHESRGKCAAQCR